MSKIKKSKECKDGKERGKDYKDFDKGGDGRPEHFDRYKHLNGPHKPCDKLYLHENQRTIFSSPDRSRKKADFLDNGRKKTDKKLAEAEDEKTSYPNKSSNDNKKSGGVFKGDEPLQSQDDTAILGGRFIYGKASLKYCLLPF